MTARDPQLIPWLAELHRRSVMSGWDFAALDGRLESEDPPWDFDDEVRDALRASEHAVDIGTGGGERLLTHLAAIGDQHGVVTATEGWEDNQPIARAALTPHGIDVLAYDPELRERLPLPDASQDLVLNRHEAVDAAEIARVLRPGGRLFTQQVDGRDGERLREWFGGAGLYDHVTMENLTAEIADAGFRIDRADDWIGAMRFRDIGTLVEYLAMVPWDVPDFDVHEHEEQLHALAAMRPIEIPQRRFRIIATRL
ncbi:class I SAM-dependent methyltransferase [Microbacterium gorillae]|uniref:class I SAM-dependent methyltransferase n=1 Tax=Microbacterium gorillae TaxID=1231063 RepID=UPI003D96F24C